jgi:hypothetical protein
MLLTLLKQKSFAELRAALETSPAILRFLLEVMAETYLLFTKKRCFTQEAYTLFHDLKTEVTKQFELFLSDPTLLPVSSNECEELNIQLIGCLFQLFNSSCSITTLAVLL